MKRKFRRNRPLKSLCRLPKMSRKKGIHRKKFWIDRQLVESIGKNKPCFFIKKA